MKRRWIVALLCVALLASWWFWYRRSTSRRYTYLVNEIRMNIIEQFDALVGARNFRDALPVIREIVRRAPSIATSHFNLGVCLDELGRHSEAAEAFIKAQELDIEDWGTHYRIIRSLFLAGDFATLHEFVDYSCGMSGRVMHLICEDEAFRSLFERPEFQQLRAKYLK